MLEPKCMSVFKVHFLTPVHLFHSLLIGLGSPGQTLATWGYYLLYLSLERKVLTRTDIHLLLVLLFLFGLAIFVNLSGEFKILFQYDNLSWLVIKYSE